MKQGVSKKLYYLKYYYLKKRKMKTIILKTIILIVIYLGTKNSFAQSGNLDPSFGSGGKVITTFSSSSNDGGNAVVIQSDGKIVVAGWSSIASNYDFALVRYTINGNLDSTFGTAGKVTTAIGSASEVGNSAAIQSDGKIVVAGSSNDGTSVNFALVRYTINGSLDSTFGNSGKVTTAIGNFYSVGNSMLIQTDGKVVVAGYYNNGSNIDFALARYTINGSLDSTFGIGGKNITDIGNSDDYGNSVAIQSDGKIIVAGYTANGSNIDYALIRYNANGSLDNTFGNGGIITSGIGVYDDKVKAVAIQSDDKIVVTGVIGTGNGYPLALVRYNNNGSLDNTFGTGGTVMTYAGGQESFGYSLAIQTSGKIVVSGVSINVGSNADFVLLRYNTNGTLDNAFGIGGKVITDFGNTNDFGNSVAIQSDGKIVVAGFNDNSFQSDMVLARYTNTINTVTEEFNTEDLAITVFPNPTNGLFNLQINKSENIQVKIYNVFDECVYQQKGRFTNLQIDLTTLPNGIYFTNIITEKGVVLSKKILLYK
jgi:uncharacterized delta-60 repeat protein